MCAALSSRKAFVLVERLGGEVLEAYSCGNGRFIPGIPSTDIEVCFRVDKDESSLTIQIYDMNLLQWLHEIFLPHSNFNDVSFGASISMRTLLPCYPKMSTKFNKGKREGHNFDALELFVRHFLREGSIFACFGFERLYEEQILTELHFRDIHSQNRSISEDLDLLDEAIEELSKHDIQESSRTSSFIKKPFLLQLRAAIKQRDLSLVRDVFTMDQGSVDATTLCLAIRYYERAVFLLLLKRGAQVDGDGFTAGPLYHAARIGHMEAVQLLLLHGANIEGKSSCINATPMDGTDSSGHLGIVQHLFEEEGANINGNGCMSPLSCAIKHRHTYIVDYLLKAGANVLEEDFLELLSQFVEKKEQIYEDILQRSIAGMDNHARESLRHRANSEGHFEIVRYLKEFANNSSNGANLERHFWPQDTAELSGQLQTASSPLVNGICDYQTRWYEDSKPADGPIESNKLFEEPTTPIGSDLPACSTWLERERAMDNNVRRNRESMTCGTAAEDLGDEIYTVGWISLISTEYVSAISFLDSEHESPRNPPGYKQIFEAIEVGNCPTVAAIQAQNRRIMTRRLIAEVASSCEKLLNAGIKKGASASLKTFIGHVGTSLSVWRRGTRAIRDLCEGYMPPSLSDIVSALQVADAMRSVVPPSQLSCLKKEFVDDIPRWASLLTRDDERLFFEIVHHLWGVPTPKPAPFRDFLKFFQPTKQVDAFQRPLENLQLLVACLVRSSGLFNHESGNFCGSYLLQTLRQQYLSIISYTHTYERRHPLTEWCPSPMQGTQENMYSTSSKPPDPEVEQSRTLARITVLMAGAIFGAILLYLCLSRYGFSNLYSPILTSDNRQGWDSDRIIIRNYVILSMYLGFTSHVGFGSQKSTDHLPPHSPPTERVQDYTTAVQSSYESQCTSSDSLSAPDNITDPGPADSSPSLFSTSATSSSATVISPLPTTTATNVPTSTGASVDERVKCEHCSSKFKLGKNGRRGQASNLRKHMKNHHPEELLDYRRVIYKCRYNCGTADPNKWNIKVHEEKHCAVNKKGRQPRRHGKWRQAATGTL